MSRLPWLVKLRAHFHVNGLHVLPRWTVLGCALWTAGGSAGSEGEAFAAPLPCQHTCKQIQAAVSLMFALLQSVLLGITRPGGSLLTQCMPSERSHWAAAWSVRCACSRQSGLDSAQQTP